MTSKAYSVLLVRHGQTALNAEGRIRGLADPELDPVGIEQAHATARALRPRGITQVLSSPLQRAAATAQIIADINGLTPTLESAFNDRDYGPWTGHIKADVIEQWGNINNAPSVEPESTVLARAFRALNTLTVAPDNGPIAIVTHDAIIRPILASIQLDIAPHVDTGSWAEISRTESEWEIISVDNTPA